MKETTKRKPAKKASKKKKPVPQGNYAIRPTNKGHKLPVMYYDGSEKSIALLKDELQRIPPGFGSAVLFNAGTFRQTLAALEKAFKGLIGSSNVRQYRFGKDIWNGQNKFKGITVHRYNYA